MSVNFDRAAGFYDDTRGYPEGVAVQVAQLYIRAGQLTPTSKIVEPGIGTGRISLPLAAASGAQIVGVDLSTAMMGKLRAKPGAAQVHTIEGDAMQLPLASDAFDAAISSHVFHLVSDHREALAEIARVLRPGGVLLHAWIQSGENNLRKVWRAAIDASGSSGHSKMAQFRGVGFLAKAGWRQTREPQMLSYTDHKSANDIIADLRGRVWSSLWEATDEEIEQGVAAVLAEVGDGDLDQPHELQQTQKVAAFLPPR